MPYLPLDDGRLFYTEEGTGETPVLMVHGWSCDGGDWSWLAADLARDHRCVLVDNRGHGRSSALPGPYLPQVLAADAARLIETLGLDRPIVVGHSMGGVVASVLAVERPDLVRALVLVDPAYGAKDAALAPVLAALRQAPHATANAVFSRFYSAHTPSWLPVWHRRRTAGVDEAVVRDAFLGLYEGEGLGRRVVGETYLRRRRVPTLAVYAGATASTAAWDRTLDHGPLDEITVWPEHGHFLHQEDPERFAREVRAWLGQLPAAG